MAILTGYAGNIDTATQPIWGGSAGVWVPQTTATVFEIDSSSANDAAAGTGARTVLVEGLNASFQYASEIVTMTGTTAVNTVGTYLHISKLTVLTAGSGGVNAGTIWAEKAGASVETAWMAAGANVSDGLILGCAVGTQQRLDRLTAQVSCAAGAGISASLAIYRRSAALWTSRIVWAGLAVTQQTISVGLDDILNPGDYAKIDITTSANTTRASGVLVYTQVTG